MVRFLSCLAVVAMLVLVGCQQVLHPNFPEYKGYKKAPYTVKGTRFVPMSVESALHYKATGIASHYEADGAIGAIGQNLYRHQRYAAHRTLPLPCTVRITCHRTGKSCIARVADRGPYIRGRLIDMSTKVARELGFYERGLDTVTVEVISVGDGKWRRFP